MYSLIIYEIVNFSFFTLYSLLLLSFFLYLKSVPIYVIVHVYTCTCTIIMPSLSDHTYLISARMRNFAFDEMTKFSKGASDKKSRSGTIANVIAVESSGTRLLWGVSVRER